MDEAAHLLATDLRVIVGKLIRRLREEVRVGDLSWSQMTLLARLERNGPSTLTTLAKAEGVRSQSMGETVAALRAQGLIDGTPDPDDGRQTLLSVTETCRDLIRANRAAREDWLFQGLQSHFTATEQDQLAAAVTLLKRLTD